jgi:protein SCO1/2
VSVRPLVTRLLPLILAVGLSGCASSEPVKTYPIEGQVLAVDTERQQLTVKHGDIPGLMPGMTMSFPVATPDLLEGRQAGELIKGTLEVSNAVGRLTAVEHLGFEELPPESNAALMAGGLLNVGDDVPDTAFVDQDNRRRSLAEWRGSATLVTFIYTRCPLPNFCPLMDQNFARIQAEIVSDAALTDRARLISISFDPDYDTPAVLAKHAEALQARPSIWTFLTGDRATIDRFAARLGVGVIREDSAGITHNLRTVLMGPDGRIVRIYSGNDWKVSTVLADLRDAAGLRPRP